MKKPIQYCISSAIALFLLIFTYKLCTYIGETFFFDKLYYQKSLAHGYAVCNGTYCPWEYYGKRARDIPLLLSLTQYPEASLSSKLSKNINTEFRIAILGDSGIWGQGLRNEDRLVSLLENKLNTIRKTKVYAFAMPGDDVNDHLEKLTLLNTFPIDIWIYSYMKNDIFLDNSKQFGKKSLTKIENMCSKMGIHAGPLGYNSYDSSINAAWKNSSNRCAMAFYLSALPQNTIILNTNGDWNEYWQEDPLYIMLKSQPRNDLVYQTPIIHNENHKPFYVSEIDRHPSKIANLLLFDILFSYIATSSAFQSTK